MKHLNSLVLAAILLPAAATAQVQTTANEPTPGSSAILQANYGKAERALSGSSLGDFDAAKSINLGIVMGMTGRAAEAEKLFNEVIRHDEVAIVVANGDSKSSHDVARKALAQLQAGTLGR